MADATAQIEQEKVRQQWLHAMALTPWVATESFSNAPRSTYWSIAEAGDRDAPNDTKAAAQETAPTKAATNDATPTQQTTSNPATAALQQLTGKNNQQRTKSAVATQPPPAAKPQSSGEPAPKLVTCLAGNTLLIAAQQDDQLPEPSVSEQQLFASLQQLFGQSGRRYPFSCPNDAPQANATLAAFVDGLALQGCQQCVFCLTDAQSKFLLGEQARHAPFKLGELPAVIISSLNEMLADPLTHKRRSWQSICQAGLVK